MTHLRLPRYRLRGRKSGSFLQPIMDSPRPNLAQRAWLSLAILAAAMGLMIFAAAGTVRYWEAWVYLLLFFGMSTMITLDLLHRDPALLERRMKGGPAAERR